MTPEDNPIAHILLSISFSMRKSCPIFVAIASKRGALIVKASTEMGRFEVVELDLAKQAQKDWF